MDNSKDGLQTAINILMTQAVTNGNVVTEEEMAQKVSLSKEQLLAYLNGDARITEGLVGKLLSSYGIQSRVVEFRVEKNVDIPPGDEEECKE